MDSSSSSEQYASSGSIPTSPKHGKSRKRRDRRASSPTDSDDEDPFHYDSILSSSPTKREDDSPSRALSSSLLRRASIVPVDPTAEPAPHRFSLLRERASEETIFVQEICDAEGRRWSLRVPASGLPEDMVHMLEELEKLANELGQALPRIVVTCSAESLSMMRMERETAVCSSELLRPPAVGDVGSVGYDAGTGLSLIKEKHRIIDPGHGSEEPARPSESSSAAVSSASENSLTCIYLPEVRRLQHNLLPRHFHRLTTSFPARSRVLIGQLNLSRLTTRRRLPQQVSTTTTTTTTTGNPMPAPACLLLSTQGAPTSE